MFAYILAPLVVDFMKQRMGRKNSRGRARAAMPNERLDMVTEQGRAEVWNSRVRRSQLTVEPMIVCSTYVGSGFESKLLVSTVFSQQRRSALATGDEAG